MMLWELGQDDDHNAARGGSPLLPLIAAVAERAPMMGWQAGEQMASAAAGLILAASNKEEL